MKDKKTESAIVSVIMPVYNTASYLAEAVESVTNQSFSDWELILINDGSTDDSGTICESYAASGRRIHDIHQEKRGVTAASKAGP